MKLSIVICTRNREHQLQGVLHALAAIRTERPWEIILVDNASTDGTEATIRAFMAGHPQLPIRYVHEAQKGLGAARDTGWRAASGDIISFTDDDCYPSPDFVDALLQVYEEHPRIGFVGGRIELFDPDDAPITIDRRKKPEYVREKRFLPAGAFQGANLSFRRETLERIGGVDRALGAGTPFPCEDIDSVASSVWSGFHGAYDPRPVVYHHHRRRGADVPVTHEGYDRGRGAYYIKYIVRSDTRLAYLAGWARRSPLLTIWGSWHQLSREIHAAIAYLRAEGAARTRLIFLPPLMVAALFARGMKLALAMAKRVGVNAVWKGPDV